MTANDRLMHFMAQLPFVLKQTERFESKTLSQKRGGEPLLEAGSPSATG
jgi:hypothetical protein